LLSRMASPRSELPSRKRMLADVDRVDQTVADDRERPHDAEYSQGIDVVGVTPPGP
jgi:hypothetical protein